ncbi:MAG: hypothetical protein RLP44_32535 [Aggregatilineales bacterium]
MKLNQYKGYGVFLIALLILPLLIAGCGGDDSPDESALPTRVVVSDATAEVTENSPAELPSQTPEMTDEVSTENNTPPQEASSTPEGTAESAPPPVDAPPNFNQQGGDATEDPNGAPVGPPISSTSMPSNAGPAGLNANATTDFSGLSVGDSLLVSGILSIVDGTDAEVAILTDVNGVTLEVETPLGMAQPMDGQQVDMVGEIVEASRGTGAEFAILPNAITSANGLGGDAPTGDGNTNNAPPAPGNGDVPNFPGVGTSDEVLDIELESDLTALGAYDALGQQISDSLEGSIWFSVTGSESSGWTLEFINLDEQLMTRYTVNTEGQVTRSGGLPATPISENEDLAIDRRLVVVDSDDVTAQLSEANNTPFGSPLITLLVDAGGGISWVVSGPEALTFDATQPLDD